MARKPIEITTEMIQECERLAALGLNERQVSDALKMSYSTFQKYKSRFRESLKKGRQALRERITTKLLENIDAGSETSIIFAIKRLGLLQPTIETAKAPETAQGALKELSRIYSAVSSGEITEAQGDKLSVLIEKFLRAFEASDLEERIEELEKHTRGE